MIGTPASAHFANSPAGSVGRDEQETVWCKD
jgi:hypothetical protein